MNRLIFISFLLFFWFTSSIAQEDSKVKDDCITVQEVKVPFDSKQFVVNTIEEQKENYNLIYYADEDEFTFWYKLIITQNCKLKFAVQPSTPGDDYDFMLYQFSSANFCEDLVDNIAVPLNENHYEPVLPAEGSNNSLSSMIVSGQKEMDVKEGEVYYISVMHLYGDDCGHRLFIDACNNSILINSVHKPCFLFSQPTISAPTPTSENPIDFDDDALSEVSLEVVNDTIIVEEFVSISGFVLDNDNNNPIDAYISFIDEVTGESYGTDANDKTGYKITLERGRRYQIKCEAFGYYEIKGVIEFLKPSVYDFYLLKIKEGRTFVMENILFHPSTYALKEESYIELDKLVRYLEKNPRLTIQIEGHTAGDNPVKETKPEYKYLGEEFNFTGTAKKLSKLRAETVKNYLVKKGVSSNRVDTEGYGAAQKLIPNPKSAEERNLNMRVEVKIVNRGEGKDYSTPPEPAIIE